LPDHRFDGADRVVRLVVAQRRVVGVHFDRSPFGGVAMESELAAATPPASAAMAAGS
jgi:hypothetical protein